jgi:hypothetical protein
MLSTVILTALTPLAARTSLGVMIGLRVRGVGTLALRVGSLPAQVLKWG